MLAQAFVRRRLGDIAWCDDVVQESLVALHCARHTSDPARPFVPWLYAMVQNRLVDALRVKRRRPGGPARRARDRDRRRARRERHLPNDRPLRMLLWHVAPLMLFAAIGAALGTWLLKRPQTRSPSVDSKISVWQ